MCLMCPLLAEKSEGMAKHMRKGRNPGPVDEWLDTLGYYRKNVAYDETCLFRAVSEQIYCCQLFHETIRRECIQYVKTHPKEFKSIISIKNWNSYLDKLSKHMAVCGNTEIQIISKTFKRRVTLFDGLNRCVENFTSEPYEKELLLCHMGEDHYDVVHKREYIQDAGFCQSIIYNTLYENVFGIPKVSDIVQTMLYQKPCVAKVEYINEENNKFLNRQRDEEDLQLNEYDYMLKTSFAPFPFKVAKALDPTIYRNIEYDTWTEMRKEMRLGEWYYGDNNLIQGSGCILKENGQDLHCYIQEIVKDSQTCVVYITSRAEKRKVKLSELHPEADAKPWPLPYRYDSRFCKNLVLSIPKIESLDKKNPRKKRDKKNSVSKGSNDSESQNENSDSNVSAFEGAPLQIQLESNNYEESSFEEPAQNQMYNYNESAWGNNSNVPHTPEPIIWSPAAVPAQNVVFNPSLSVPATPEVYPDHRYYCETYPRYNVWTGGEYIAPLPANMPPSPVEVPQSPSMFSYFFSDPTYSPTPYYHSSANISAPSQVELYPQPYMTAPHPTTPVILTPAEGTEVVMPPAPGHVVYSPAIEVPYMPSPYIYPPTPPAAWYQPSINSQGFIFPTVNSPPKTSSHI